jgi:hypothetical protein
MKINDQLKMIIYWVGMGVALVTYANVNFATRESLNKVEKRVEGLADKHDVNRIESKLDRLIIRLIKE